MNREVKFEDLGRVRYKKAWEYQEEIFQNLIKATVVNAEKRKKELLHGSYHEADNEKERAVSANQYILFCEHENVYTLGKRGNRQNLLITKNICENRGIDFHEIDRGGDITYHGPGQLVVYPIIDLEEFNIGIKSYISMLEDVVIETLKPFGIKGEKDGKAMGVWLALNINSDLSYFDYINPCGFTDKGVTSMEKDLNRKLDFKEVAFTMKNAFENIFGMKWLEP